MSENKDAAKLLDRLDTALSLVADKLEQYGPDVVDLTLTTIRLYSGIMFVLFTLILIFLLWASVKLFKYSRSLKGTVHIDGEIFSMVASGFSFFFFLLILAASDYVFYILSMISPLVGIAYRVLAQIGFF